MRTGSFQTYFPGNEIVTGKVRHTSCQLTPKSRQRRKEKRGVRH